MKTKSNKTMKTLEELEKAYSELGKEIEKLKTNQYPIYCKSKESTLVVKFTGLTEGEIVVQNQDWNVGEQSPDWKSHTDTEQWEKLQICPKTGFFDGQLVWAYRDTYTHLRELRFYDAVYQCTFTHNGKRNGNKYNNHSPFEGNYQEWTLKAFQTLTK